jgi:hypothetical protein
VLVTACGSGRKVKFGGLVLLSIANSQLEKLRIEERHDVGKRRFQPGRLLGLFLFLVEAFG